MTQLVPLTLMAFLISSISPVLTYAQDVAWSPPRTVYIAEAGHTVDGLFLKLWREYPEILGNPVTEEFKTETPFSERPDDEHIVQYYEGVALVYLPDEPAGEQVETLPIGKDAAEILAPKYPEAFQPASSDACGTMDEVACSVFAETQHSLRFGFKVFWDKMDGAELLGPPVSEEFIARDGRQVQMFERGALQWKRGEDITVRPIGKELAKRLKLDTDPIARPPDVPAYDEMLFVPPEPVVSEDDDSLATGVGGFGPGPIQGGSKEIVISISAQRMWAYENGEMIVTTLVSTGTAEIPFTTTPIGRWSVLTKYEVQDMKGTVSGEDYFVPNVPYVMYFDNLGNALHGTYWHSNFGTPMSHGCVNLPLDVAEFLYTWTPIGTPVTVVA
ncbi:MAG TPA: L,D-transpeptidase [Thermomicrobiales bacterium]|nr:L,D-transpeptidase [Thermomicrobiales bacterium]